MKKLIATYFSFIVLINVSFGQSDLDIPIIEGFETQNEWPWSPWNNISNGSSTKTINSSHSGKFGLNAGTLFYRTDKVFGTSGQVISYWVRFTRPSRAHCGFGVQQDSMVGFYLCADPSTKSFHFANSPDYTFPILKSKSQDYRLYAWYRVEINFNTQTNITGKLFKSDGITLINSITLEIPNIKPGGISFRGDGNGAVHLDEIRGGTRIVKPSVDTSFVPEKGRSFILKNILFETDKSVLLPSSYAELDKLVKYLSKNSFNLVEIYGHTDNVGHEPYNRDLSLKRANAVADYLVSKGINKAKVLCLGFGGTKPISSNGSENDRSKNRRVEILIR